MGDKYNVENNEETWSFSVTGMTREEIDIYINASKLYACLHDLSIELRSARKYGTVDEDIKYAYKYEELFRRILDDNGVEL